MTNPAIDILTEKMHALSSPAEVIRDLLRGEYENLRRIILGYGYAGDITDEDIEEAISWTIREARIAWDEADALRDNPHA